MLAKNCKVVLARAGYSYELKCPEDTSETMGSLVKVRVVCGVMVGLTAKSNVNMKSVDCTTEVIHFASTQALNLGNEREDVDLLILDLVINRVIDRYLDRGCVMERRSVSKEMSM